MKTKLAILSRGPALYSTQRLREAAAARGHDVRVLDTLACSIVIAHQRPAILYQGRALPRPDAVVPRIGASVTFFGCALVRQLEHLGVYTLASSQAIELARDKLRSLQALTYGDVPFPATALVRDPARIGEALAAIGGPPAVIKVVEGTQGVGVILADTVDAVRAILETLHQAGQDVLLQRFVAESHGRDVRAFVVGGRVVAAMRRYARRGEFRANVHRGARAEGIAPARLDRALAATAVRAADRLGLEVAGVDLVESDDGPMVLEVNASPGLEGIEAATGVDVAGEVIAHVERALGRSDTAARGLAAQSPSITIVSSGGGSSLGSSSGGGSSAGVSSGGGSGSTLTSTTGSGSTIVSSASGSGSAARSIAARSSSRGSRLSPPSSFQSSGTTVPALRGHAGPRSAARPPQAATTRITARKRTSPA